MLPGLRSRRATRAMRLLAIFFASTNRSDQGRAAHPVNLARRLSLRAKEARQMSGAADDSRDPEQRWCWPAAPLECSVLVQEPGSGDAETRVGVEGVQEDLQGAAGHYSIAI